MQVEQIPREENEKVDYLARMASADSKEGLFRISLIPELSKPSYEENEQVQETATSAILNKRKKIGRQRSRNS